MKTNPVENPVFGWIGNLADLALLNLCWLLGCLPVITAGASSQALFHCAGKMAAGRKWTVREDFIQPFRREFALSVRVWLPLLVFELLFAFDLWYGGRTGRPLLTTAAVIFGAVWCAVTVWSFALFSRFQYRRARDVWRDALAVGAASLPVSLAAVLLTVWIPAALLLFPAFVSGIFPALVLLDGSLSALLLSALMRRTFRHIENRRERAKPVTEEETI